MVRALYGLAALAVLVMAWVVGTDRAFSSLGGPASAMPPPMNVFAGAILLSSAALLVGIAAILAYRAARPLWWAKLLAGVAPAWILFSVAYSVMAQAEGRWDALSALTPAVGGLLVILAGAGDLIVALVRRQPVLGRFGRPRR